MWAMSGEEICTAVAETAARDKKRNAQKLDLNCFGAKKSTQNIKSHHASTL